MANLLSGKEISEEIKARLSKELKELSLSPLLAIVEVGSREDSNVYIRMKKNFAQSVGVQTRHIQLPNTITQSELKQKIEELNKDKSVHGIVVQLPFDCENTIDTNKIINLVTPHKDVDGISDENSGKLLRGEIDGTNCFLPCTPYGCLELIKRSGVQIGGSNAVVIGRSKIVGSPMAQLLIWNNATVTVCHSKTKNISDIVRKADIVVVAVGQPLMVKKDWIKPGAVVIDCGITSIPDSTKKSGYRLVGDVDFEECKAVASAITPVPGGVGPMTVAMLISNTVNAAKAHLDLSVRSVDFSKLTKRSESMSHIHEKIAIFQKPETKPKPLLKASPSLGSATTPVVANPQRTKTRIGVSSLTRNYNKQKLSVFNQNFMSNSNTNLTIVGSEPNLYNSKFLSNSSNHLTQSPNSLKLSINSVNNDSNGLKANGISNNSFDSINGLNEKLPNMCNRRFTVRNMKETRANSDPTALHYSIPSQSSSPSPPVPTHEYCTKGMSDRTQPSFHQSLNNIAITTTLPLRSVGSDLNVNNNTNIQSICIPPPPDYANCVSENPVIKSPNVSQSITSQKGNSTLNKLKTNGKIIAKNLINEQNGSISDLQQLKQKSRDLNLPLITALFNDRSLMVPKTVPGTRQRHISTARDIRRYSCSSEICSDITNKHISTIPLNKLENNLSLNKVNYNERPTSWHIEYPEVYNKHVWKQYSDNHNQQNQFNNVTADFIDRLWAEHHLTT